MNRTWLRIVLRLALEAGVILAVSLLYHYVIPANNTTVALTYLLVVLGSAALWGLPEALFASVCSMLLFDYYFLPPVPAFGIADPQNWVDFGAFVVTSLVASELSTRSKKRAVEATRRQREIERMYALSCYLMSGDSAAELAARIPAHVQEIFACPGVAFYDRGAGQIRRAGAALGIDDSSLMRMAGSREPRRNDDANTAVVAVNLGATTIGSLGFVEAAVSSTTMQAIANLVALAMDRARKQDAAGQAEAARRHQELKSMLLDALAHEFQTPLTSIRAAIAAMLAESPPREQQEWLDIMGEESARLSSMMVEAIQMARIEAGHMDLDKQTHTVEDLIHSALEKEMAEPAQVLVELPEGLPEVFADAGLIHMVIRQIVGNALRYSRPGSPIRLQGRTTHGGVLISVTDSGPGISPEEQRRIFEKYYRGQQGQGHLTGMGMGLPIARQVVEAHGGRIWVESLPGTGTTFSFTLPLVAEGVSV